MCVGLFNLRGSDKINALFYAYAVLFHDNARWTESLRWLSSLSSSSSSPSSSLLKSTDYSNVVSKPSHSDKRVGDVNVKMTIVHRSSK